MKYISADDLKEKVNALPFAPMIKELLFEQIDHLPAMGEDKPFIYAAKIPLLPRTKKNHQNIIINPKTKRPMIVQNSLYKEYENDAGWFLAKPSKPIDYPVNIKCLFYRKDKHRVDLTNLLEAIDDILVKYKVLADDSFNIVVGHDGSRVFIDPDEPRIEVYIEPICNYTEKGVLPNED